MVLTLKIIINMPFWPHFVFNLERMHIVATSLLRDSYHHSSCCIYRLFYFFYLIEFVFTVSLLSLQYGRVYDYQYVLSFRFHINPDQLCIKWHCSSDKHSTLSKDIC